jgi:Arc/MetJ-type ribon-helix-helix transcriptional regulator
VSTQIAVRLPDELVAYLDQAVADGRGKSRAELVARFIAKDARRQRAEDDFLRLVAAGAVVDGVFVDEEALAIARAVPPLPIDD